MADEWMPLHQGSDGAFWMAVGHVILKEIYADASGARPSQDYMRQYTDAAFLVTLDQQANGNYRPGKLLRASPARKHKGRRKRRVEVSSSWTKTPTSCACPKAPSATAGRRKKASGTSSSKTANRSADSIRLLELKGSTNDNRRYRNHRFLRRHQLTRSSCVTSPFVRFETVNGPVLVTTAMELYFAQYGVNRGFEGEWPKGYDDDSQPFTPAWQERFTGVAGSVAVNFAREWARTAEHTGGKCSVIIGAGVNHWYHNNLIYRAVINALMFCGCIGKNGGGLEPLRRPGKTRPANVLGSHRLRRRLGRSAAPAEFPVVPLHAFRPVAL